MEKRLQQLKDATWEYYRHHRREMPWRRHPTPYNVVVSELMLQQTQVSRVQAKFPPFLEALPDFVALAGASRSQLLGLWQGLGYNRRAVALQGIAQRVIGQYQGVLPDDPNALQEFPGIGPGTAGSIAAFAYDRPTVFIETNIRRVFLHHLFPNAESVPDKQLLPYVEQAIDPEHPREWYYALMDYGSYLATQVPNPNRRSKHYAKQSPFEGSDRQIRGAILRVLLQHGRMERSELAHELGSEDMERLNTVIDGLLNERLIAVSTDKKLTLE